jgi:hypothetical protein
MGPGGLLSKASPLLPCVCWLLSPLSCLLPSQFTFFRIASRKSQNFGTVSM